MLENKIDKAHEPQSLQAPGCRGSCRQRSQHRDSVKCSGGIVEKQKGKWPGWSKVLRSRVVGGKVGEGGSAISHRTLFSNVRSWNFILRTMKNYCRVLSKLEA